MDDCCLFVQARLPRINCCAGDVGKVRYDVNEYCRYGIPIRGSNTSYRIRCKAVPCPPQTSPAVSTEISVQYLIKSKRERLKGLGMTAHRISTPGSKPLSLSYLTVW